MAMTDEEFLGLGAKKGAPAPAAPARPMTDEEFMSAGAKRPAQGKPGLLGNAPDESTTSGLAKGVGTAVIKGLSHIPGIAGDMRDLIGMGIGAARTIGSDKPLTQNIAESIAAGQRDPVLGWLPNGEDIAKPILGVTGAYAPESSLGKLGMAGVEAATSWASPGGKQSLVRNMADSMRRTAAPNFAAGVVGEGVGDVSGNPLLGAVAGAVTGATTGVARDAVRGLRDAKSDAGRRENAERIVGDIGRQAATDVDAAKAGLGAATTAAPGSGVPGVRETTAQASGDAGMRGLEARARRIDAEGGGENNARLDAQIEGNRRAITAEGDRVAENVRARSPEIDVAAGYGITPGTAQTDASVAARAAFDALEQARDRQASALWQAPELQAAGMYRRRSVAALQDYLRGLGEVRGAAFPAPLRRLLDTLANGTSPQMSFQELQDLRSLTLSTARKAATNPEAMNTGDLYGFAQRIADVMQDRRNIRFGGAYGEIDAWNAAREATRRYHEDFGGKTGSKLAEGRNGQRAVAEEATFDKIFGGNNAVQNLRELQRIPGLDIARQAEDWLVGQLTRNGERIVTPQDVQRFLADRKYGTLVREIPGLDARLQGIAIRAGESAQNAIQRQAADVLSRALDSGNPAAVVRAIERNRGVLSAGAGTRAEGAALAALESSARRVGAIGGGMSGTETLDRLMKGRIIDIVMGKAAGKFADAAGGAGAAGVTNVIAGVPVPPIAAEVVGAATGLGAAGHAPKGVVSSAVNKFLFGSTQKEAVELLQRAMREPELMRVLMDKPSPQRIESLSKMLGGSISNNAPSAAVGARAGTEAGNQITVEAPVPQFSGGGFMRDIVDGMAQHFDKGGIVKKAVGALSSPYIMRQTVKDAERNMFPGIYKNPKSIAAEAKAMTAPEDPALKELFGVTRADMYEMAKDRVGNEEPVLKMKANPRGSEAMERLQTPRNEQRLIDVLTEGERIAPELTNPMDVWYFMDPAYNRTKELLGPDAPRAYRQFNALTGMASPGSDVMTEINRGTAANMMATQGRFEDFLRYGGMREGDRGADFPDDLRAVRGHFAHSTAQALPMKNYLDKGFVDMGSAKVPLYIQASSPTELGFQTSLPVPDAHWTRAVGAADTRGNTATPGVSMKMSEYQTAGPWWRDRVAGRAGIESVPAQARIWGLMAPQTGVDTAIGAPKLELLAIRIRETARRLGVSLEQARDMVLTGQAHANVATPVGLGALGAYAATRPERVEAPEQ